MDSLELRKASFEDVRMLWEWANDAETRAASFDTRPIAWESHVAWLKKKLADPNCLLLVSVVKGEPVGLVRFDIDGRTAELSVSVGPAFRGRGYGLAMVRRAVEEVFSTTDVACVDAFVRPHNARSIALFSAAGFEQVGHTSRRGHAALCFRRRRDGSS